MANNIQLNKIADMAASAPLAEILDTVEMVASFVPGIGTAVGGIIKVLRILTKLQPAAAKTMHGIANMQSPNKFSFIPDGATPELNALRQMIDIALEDGVLTEDEEAFLINKAESAGIDKDLFLMGLRNQLKKNNNLSNNNKMDKETLNQTKINVLAEKMRESVRKGTIGQEMSVLRMEASGYGIDNDQFNTMLEEAKHRATNDKDTQSIVNKYKKPILIVLVAFILIELFLPVSFGWKLLLILVTVMAAIVLLANVIVKNRKK